jgi:hypothetical protein
MKTLVILLFTFCSIILVTHAQVPHLDVESHAKIRGNLDIHHMDDSTTLLIGRNAGVNSLFPYRKSNTIVGSYAGNSNTEGEDNSFFGRSAGHSNTTGWSNSFFGRSAGYLNSSGKDNSFFGRRAGFYITGSRNVSIGHASGPPSDSGDVNDRLYIDVETTNEPLIYGEFDSDLLTVHHPLANPGNNTGFRIKNTGENKNWWNLYTVNSNGNLFLYEYIRLYLTNATRRTLPHWKQSYLP